MHGLYCCIVVVLFSLIYICLIHYLYIYIYIYISFPTNKARSASGRTSSAFLQKSPSVSLKLTHSPCLSGTLEKRFVFA